MFRVSVLAAIGTAVWVTAATAVPVTYSINDRFQSFSNNLNAAPDVGQGGLLAGTLTVDPDLAGSAKVVGYSLTSNLPNGSGGSSLTSVYDSNLAGQTLVVTDAPSGLTLDFRTPVGSTMNRLLLSFGTTPIGGPTVSFTASELYLNCKGVYYGGLRNSCTLPNFGIGLGTGRYGSNGATEMTGTRQQDNGPSPVPLPASGILLAAALAAPVALRRRGKARR